MLISQKDQNMSSNAKSIAQPINQIEWVPAAELVANDYNPNHVMQTEMRLLRLSMLEQGWIQPVIVVREESKTVIVDGFHRTTLVRADKQVFALTDGLVPCVVMELNTKERKMLTIRINRAKGSHSALKMHEIVVALITEHGATVEEVMEGIGATRHEVDTLMTENLFARFDVDNITYQKAWRPK